MRSPKCWLKTNHRLTRGSFQSGQQVQQSLALNLVATYAELTKLFTAELNY